MDPLLTVKDVAMLLSMSVRQVYELTATRTRTGNMRHNPIPYLKINGNLRFAASDLDAWLQRERKAA